MQPRLIAASEPQHGFTHFRSKWRCWPGADRGCRPKFSWALPYEFKITLPDPDKNLVKFYALSPLRSRRMGLSSAKPLAINTQP